MRGKSPGTSTNQPRFAQAAQRFGGTHSGGGRGLEEGGSGLEKRAAIVRQNRASARGGSVGTRRAR